MTTAPAPYPRGSALARGWRRFRRWRRGRPFWGGLLTIVSAAVFFLSGHLTPTNIRISFSPQEFLGWMIPLILALCGLLMLVSPGQRVFYGVLAAAVSVGGLIGLNLGGFLLGMLLGMIGGALGASWTPVSLPPQAADPPSAVDAGMVPVPAAEFWAGPEAGAGPGAGPGPGAAAGPGAGPSPEAGSGVPDAPDAGEPVEWRRPSGPLTDTLPTSKVSPLATPAAERRDVTGAVPGKPAPDAGGGGPDAGGAGAASEGGATEPDGDRRPSPGGLPRHAPRGLAVILLVLTVVAVGATTLRLQTPAGAAPSCAEVFASLMPTSTPTGKPAGGAAAGKAAAGKAAAGKAAAGKAAAGKAAAGKAGAGKAGSGTSAAGKPAPGKTGTAKPAGTGKPAPAGAGNPATTAAGPPSPSANPSAGTGGGSGGDHGGLGGAIDGVLGGLGKLLGLGSDPAPSRSPSPTPSSPTTGDPAPGSTPTGTGQPPTGTAPAAGPSASPSGTGHPSSPAGGRSPTASGSPAASDCPTGDPNALVAPLDDTVAAQNPALQITADLSLVEMTYKGITELPVHGGNKIRVLEFTMDSSTSIPFELQVPMATSGGHTLSYKSSKLTVSGHVTFYTTRISGNLFGNLLGGLLPVTFTPAAPPPLPPVAILVPVTFTDATLDLVLVHADVLTAPALGISYIS